MKQTVTYYDFVDAFTNYDRIDNFTREGLELLFNFLEELEQDQGEEMELDVIAICCEWNEDTIEDVISDYGYPDDDPQTYLEDNTLVAGYTDVGTVVYAAF